MIDHSNRISIDPRILSGKPVFRGTRIPISIVLQMLRDGATFQKIIEEYPKLTGEDIKAAIAFKLKFLDKEIKKILDRWNYSDTTNFLQDARDGTIEEAENDAIELRQFLYEKDELIKE